MRLWIACIILILSSGTALSKEASFQAHFHRLPSLHLNKHSVQSVSALKGKVVLVDFWASWCSPCKAALPHYNGLYNKYRDQGLVVLGINEDDDTLERDAFLKTVQIDFPLFYDKDKVLVKDFDVKALPTLYVFDRKTKPVAFYRGFDEKDPQVLEKLIQRLLKE